MTHLPDPHKSRAVLVGASLYARCEALPAVDNNLSVMAEVLTDPEICGLSLDSVSVIAQPESPTRVLDAIYDAAENCTDTLVFYFAGHGLTSLHADELLLAIPNTDPRRPHSAIRFEDVRLAVLSARRAPKKLVILDCCFSGRAMVGSMENSVDLAARSDIDGSYILTAAAETKTALAPPGETYTAFTGELVSLLKTGAPSDREHLDMASVFSHLYSELAAKSRPLPQQRNRNAGSSIILAKNRQFSPKRDRVAFAFDYASKAIDADLKSKNPIELLRSDMRAVYLPYAQRVNRGSLLAHIYPECTAEVCEVLAEIATESDLDPSERIELLGTLCALGWRVEEIKSELLTIAKTSHQYGLVTARSKACKELQKLKANDFAVEGYMSILMDPGASVKSRSRQALYMGQSFPNTKNAALRFMWSAGKDHRLEAAIRVEILRLICDLDPASIEKVTQLIRQIKRAPSSMADDGGIS
ncbi:caspase family protein [Streptomyces sp. NBC_00715]|uniref:caspase family protein n=1 Tax=Streptomyces sp. NBC_00715 TaxID=2975811 RepID=UPI003868974C